MIRSIKNAMIFVETMLNKVFMLLKGVRFGRNMIVKGRIFIINDGTCIIGDNVRINSRLSANPIGGDTQTNIVVRKDAVLKIANNVALSNTTIFCDTSIVIEDDVMIGGSVKIYDTDFHPITYLDRKENWKESINASPVVIKQGAFIGAHSIILKGLVIGTRSVVGAGSVVTKNVPDDEIWAGNPARFIKKIVN